MKEFENKVVCITGADGGIGREITKKFAAEGATFIFCSLMETPQYNEFLVSLKKIYNVEYHSFYFDFSDEESIKVALKEIKSLKLKINVLINNAGIPHLAILPFTKISDVKKVFQVNYFAQLQITQGLLGCLARDGESVILNAASIAGIDGDIGNVVYGATKASSTLERIVKCPIESHWGKSPIVLFSLTLDTSVSQTEATISNTFSFTFIFYY